MAPEIYETESYDEKVDVWSLGILIYELLHGKSPFVGKTAFRIFKNILSNKLDFSSNIDSCAQDFILKTLKIDPTKRPSCEELLRHPFLSEENNIFSNRQTIEKYFPFGNDKFG